MIFPYNCRFCPHDILIYGITPPKIISPVLSPSYHYIPIKWLVLMVNFKYNGWFSSRSLNQIHQSTESTQWIPNPHYGWSYSHEIPVEPAPSVPTRSHHWQCLRIRIFGSYQVWVIHEVSISLDWFKGKKIRENRKTPYLTGNFMVSCRFSLKPIHWPQLGKVQYNYGEEAMDS
jgi:hypothetical protein